jgi:hypothetical protein
MKNLEQFFSQPSVRQWAKKTMPIRLVTNMKNLEQFFSQPIFRQWAKNTMPIRFFWF